MIEEKPLQVAQYQLLVIKYEAFKYSSTIKVADIKMKQSWNESITVSKKPQMIDDTFSLGKFII